MSTRSLRRALAERFPSADRATMTPTPRTPTAGQLAWLASLELSARARFGELPARDRRMLLSWHRAGPNADPIVAGETARMLRPREPVASV